MAKAVSDMKNKSAFMEFLPGEGEGKRRLGTRLYLAEDVYAILFCSLFKTEYRESCMEDASSKSA